ncbi:MAG: hypothetical protein CM1200mP10_10060 [Candidatus Neomarinimicrobiota bacterium]|nr:MAG: hypothetical protein CM1200mP10_10060 [Candidatus Neomarinimicrobiota bacterium]
MAENHLQSQSNETSPPSDCMPSHCAPAAETPNAKPWFDHLGVYENDEVIIFWKTEISARILQDVYQVPCRNR